MMLPNPGGSCWKTNKIKKNNIFWCPSPKKKKHPTLLLIWGEIQPIVYQFWIHDSLVKDLKLSDSQKYPPACKRTNVH